ncbi:SAM-dependent methyltransferase [Sphingomonas sp. Leaf4]|uniref:SAM-dependent methyltransferase n=1 Tax=Sphingomonas sp. Leaf4 TaxID=2876553 RepID=UPI001E2A017C|nr:SAM-dependent methyltransferase [Sphingomonas sp. Leaf4]
MPRERARSDPRWADVAATLAALRGGRRHAVRIVDTDCGCGTLLIAALAHARSLGFTAIEGRGLDRSPACLGRARRAAAALHDPAIGVAFDATDVATALDQEAEAPADILLCHHALPAHAPTAGRVVIADRHAGAVR